MRPVSCRHRCVVSWQGRGQPVMLALYGPEGEVAEPLTPVRALELAALELA